MAEVQGTNFVAEGPASEGSGEVGFKTDEHANFHFGVIGIGSTTSGFPDPVGVRGLSTDGENFASGVGVQGFSADGAGVEGVDGLGGTGVHGRSETGKGVYGQSDKGVGVFGFSNASIGIHGMGGTIGVQGGGPVPESLTDSSIFVGVAGSGVPAPNEDGFTYSYGGWFSRGLGIDPGDTGTAPLHLEPAVSEDPKPPASAQVGDLFVDNDGNLLFYTKTGWMKVQLVAYP